MKLPGGVNFSEAVSLMKLHGHERNDVLELAAKVSMNSDDILDL